MKLNFSICFIVFILAFFAGSFAVSVSVSPNPKISPVAPLFTASQGIYTALNSEGVIAATGSWDDTVITLAAGTIPFTFTLNETAYTGLSINPNGYLMLGGTTTMGYTPISSTITGRNVISAFACNLQGNAAGEIRYATIGSAPNRTFVVQWKNARKYNATGDDFNFQIRLEESTNKAIVVYGVMINNAITTTTQVGLRGLTNSVFKNVTTTTSWSAPTTGTVNSQTMTCTATVFPASGQTYTWAAPIMISINLDTTTQIRGCTIRLAYDINSLSYASAAKGSMFTGQNVGWWRAFNGSPEEDPGVLRIECIIFGAGVFVTGPGNLLNISFYSLLEGYSELTLLTTELYDPNGNVISGTSSTNGSVIIGNSPVYAKTKVWLEGPYINGSMTTSINSILPLISPYISAPNTVTAIPAGVVDWVLVELRNVYNGSPVKAQSAFLYSDGYIKTPGMPYLVFMNTTPANYYLVISHRNHLSVMSLTTINLSGSGSPPNYDFSFIDNIYGRGGVKQISIGIYAMAAGDASNNNSIAPSDRNSYWRIQTGQSGYKSADFNLNGNVSPSDLNRYWRVNAGMGTSVP
jgi:hypothetical protein